RRGGAARHDRRAEARAFFAAGDAAADEVQPLLAEGGLAAAGVGEVRVAAVDDDVVRLEQRRQLAEHLVDRSAGGDHHHDAARAFQRAHQILEALRAGELVAGVILEERVGPVGLEVPHRDRKAVLLDVEREVSAHRAEADDGEAAATHTRISRAAVSACSKARSRVRTPSSSPISAASEPSPSGTIRVDPSPPSTAASRQLPCGLTWSVTFSAFPESLTRTSGVGASPAASLMLMATASVQRSRDFSHPAYRRAA